MNYEITVYLRHKQKNTNLEKIHFYSKERAIKYLVERYGMSNDRATSMINMLDLPGRNTKFHTNDEVEEWVYIEAVGKIEDTAD